MSTLKVDAIRHNSATSDAITTASDGTCTAKLTSVGGGQLSNRNIIINPEFKIWQRGTSWSSGVNRYVMDRWYQWGYNAIPSQITGTNGSQYGVRLRHNTSTSNTFSAWSSTLEKKDIFHTIGKHLVLSFWMRKGSAFTGGMSCQIVARTDSESKINAGTNVTIGNQDIAGSLTTDWQKFTIKTTQVVPTTEVVGVNFWHHTTSGTDANNYFDLNQVQLEVGDTATTFEHRNFGDELSRCQRYFAIFPGRSGGIPFWQAYTGSSQASLSLPIPFSMRAVPSPTDPNGSTTTTGYLYNSNGVDVSSRYANNTSPTLSCGGYAPSGLGLILSFGSHQSGTNDATGGSWNGNSPGIYLDAEL